MSYNRQDFLLITDILQDYFDGLYEGNVEKLRNIFHEDCVLKSPNVRRGRDEWLDAVAQRKNPGQEGEPYRFKLVSLDIINEQAMAKVEAPLFENHFVDYLGFLKEDGKWQIVSKSYITA